MASLNIHQFKRQAMAKSKDNTKGQLAANRKTRGQYVSKPVELLSSIDRFYSDSVALRTHLVAGCKRFAGIKK